MIKLNRPDKPSELTDTIVAMLTQEYIDNDTEVWKKDYIVTPLLEMSHSKCAYCETRLKEESKYATVEHYHPKSLYPDEVVKWDNLLMICSRCNSNKVNHDTKISPIINPTVHIPKNHLSLKEYRYIQKDQIGKETCEILHLNDITEAMTPRFLVGAKITETLDEILSNLEEVDTKTSRSRITRIRNKFSGIMNEALQKAQYSAVCATAIIGFSNLNRIIELLKHHSAWLSAFDHNLGIIRENSILPPT